MSKSAPMGVTTMPACSMGHNAYAQTLGHKEVARKADALMVVQATTASKCVEGLDTSISSTLMCTAPQLMIGAVAIWHKTNISKNGMPTWVIVILPLHAKTWSQIVPCWQHSSR